MNQGVLFSLRFSPEFSWLQSRSETDGIDCMEIVFQWFFLYRLSHFSYWLCKFPFLPGGYKGSDCILPALGPAVPSNSHSNSRITTQSELYLEWVTESNHGSVMLSYGQLRRLWSLETGRCIFSTPFIARASLGTFWCPWIWMDCTGKVQIFSIIC